MILNITKETWENCGIKTVNYYNKKEIIIELWKKMSDVETQTKHSNIVEVALRRIKKYYGNKTKKQKAFQKKRNKNIKHILKVKQIFSLLKNLHVI